MAELVNTEALIGWTELIQKLLKEAEANDIIITDFGAGRDAWGWLQRSTGLGPM